MRIMDEPWLIRKYLEHFFSLNRGVVRNRAEGGGKVDGPRRERKVGA